MCLLKESVAQYRGFPRNSRTRSPKLMRPAPRSGAAARIILTPKQTEGSPGFETGKHLFGRPSDMIPNEFTQHGSKVCGDLQISSFKKLFRLETRPVAENLTAV